MFNGRKVLSPPVAEVSAQSANRSLSRVGKFSEAVSKALKLLELREKVLGPEHLNTAGSLKWLGVLYQAMGDDAKAEPFFHRTLKIDEKVLGPEHPDTGTSLNYLGLLYQAIGDYTKAEPL